MNKMKRVVFNKEDKEIVDFKDISVGNIIGFTTQLGSKGYFVYVGYNQDSNGEKLNIVHAVLAERPGKSHHNSTPNVSCGEFINNKHSYIPIKSLGGASEIEEMFVFEKLQGEDGLYSWLAKN